MQLLVRTDNVSSISWSVRTASAWLNRAQTASTLPDDIARLKKIGHISTLLRLWAGSQNVPWQVGWPIGGGSCSALTGTRTSEAHVTDRPSYYPYSLPENKGDRLHRRLDCDPQRAHESANGAVRGARAHVPSVFICPGIDRRCRTVQKTDAGMVRRTGRELANALTAKSARFKACAPICINKNIAYLKHFLTIKNTSSTRRKVFDVSSNSSMRIA